MVSCCGTRILARVYLITIAFFTHCRHFCCAKCTVHILLQLKIARAFSLNFLKENNSYFSTCVYRSALFASYNYKVFEEFDPLCLRPDYNSHGKSVSMAWRSTLFGHLSRISCASSMFFMAKAACAASFHMLVGCISASMWYD